MSMIPRKQWLVHFVPERLLLYVAKWGHDSGPIMAIGHDLLHHLFNCLHGSEKYSRKNKLIEHKDNISIIDTYIYIHAYIILMNDCSMLFYLLGVYYKICSQHLHPVRGSPSRSFQVAPLLQLLIEGRFWTGFTQAKWGFHHQERENPEFQRAARSTTSWGFNSSGWWFGTWLWFFHSVGNFIIPTDELHHFSEGWLNHQPVFIVRFNFQPYLGWVEMMRILGWVAQHV